MTGRTHDLVAFTALNLVFVTMKVVPDMTFATVITALGANMLGGLLPDVDNATSDFWDKIRGGNIIARIVKPFVGKHRMISHSLLGMVLIGFLLDLLVVWLKTFILVDMEVVWWSVMIGVASHLAADGMTKQGIPLLFPLPIDFGFPPFEFMRMTTGKFVEKWIVRTALIAANGYMIYAYYDKYLSLFRSFF